MFNSISACFLTALLLLRCRFTSAETSSVTSMSTAIPSAIPTNLVSGFFTSVPKQSPTPANPTAYPPFTDYTNTIPAGTIEYSFDFPSYDDDQYHMVFNHKDSLQLKWTVFPPSNPPILQIHCWNRTSPPNPYPLWAARVFDFNQNITVAQSLFNATGDNTTTLTVPLEAYQAFNPCQFALVDSVNKNLTRGLCVSSDFVILEDDAAPAITWNESLFAPSTTTTTWTADNASAPDWWSEFGGELPMKLGVATPSRPEGISMLSAMLIANFFLLL